MTESEGAYYDQHELQKGSRGCMTALVAIATCITAYNLGGTILDNRTSGQKLDSEADEATEKYARINGDDDNLSRRNKIRTDINKCILAELVAGDEDNREVHKKKAIRLCGGDIERAKPSCLADKMGGWKNNIKARECILRFVQSRIIQPRRKHSTN